MPRFNTQSLNRSSPDIVNLAGGPAFSESPKLELALTVLTSMVSDQYYRSANEMLANLPAQIARAGAPFAARLAIYARHKHGLRSISHALAGELAPAIGFEWKRRFYRQVVRRPDDITEILSYYVAKGNSLKKLPKAMQRGLADSLGQFDEYQLAKYRGEGHGVKLVDAVNLLHPKPVPNNAFALAALVNDELRSRGTWEAKLSAAGDDADLKADQWRDLLVAGKLPYFALLRNLRNILQQAPDLVPQACEQLVNERAILNSLVLPFRYVSAQRALQKQAGTQPLMEAVDKAATISVQNVPTFEGRTLVALDDSGSMAGAVAGRDGEIDCFTAGAIFTAAMVMSNQCDVMMFSDDARYRGVYGGLGLFGIMSELARHRTGAGTNFHPIFERATRHYDRIIILSDMQGWMDAGAHARYNVPGARRDYEKRVGGKTRVYSFDLAGYSSLQFSERDTYCLGGFSEKIFDVLKLLEIDRDALVAEIEQVQFS